MIVTQFRVVRTYVLTDISECQESRLPKAIGTDITINCMKLSHHPFYLYLAYCSFFRYFNTEN
jgi:hypothetical protein